MLSHLLPPAREEAYDVRRDLVKIAEERSGGRAFQCREVGEDSLRPSVDRFEGEGGEVPGEDGEEIVEGNAMECAVRTESRESKSIV